VIDSNVSKPPSDDANHEVIHKQESHYDTSLDYKSIVETLNIYDTFPKYDYMKDMVKMDFSTILSKPFHVDSFQWRTSDVAGYMRRFKAPYDFLTSALAKIPFKSATYWRGNICVIVSVSGTPMHQGTLVVSALPHHAFNASVTDKAWVNSHFASPHLLLSPNNATTSCLEFPFYYPVHYMKTLLDPYSTTTTTDSTYINSGYLSFYILNALQGGSTSSTSVTVNISVRFDQLEFYVPKVIPAASAVTNFQAESSSIVSGYIDGFFNGLRSMSSDLLDQCRALVRQYTGLHNPNLPVIEQSIKTNQVNYHNIVEGPTFIERMEPFVNFDRIHEHPYFNTKVDEMFMPFLLSKPQWINTFTVRATDTLGTLLASIPISPFQIINKSRDLMSIQNLCYLNSRYWRGNIVFYLHSSMSNMHFLKTLCVKQYTQPPNGTTPLFSDVLNLPSESIEFSSGGQIAKIVIPYYQDKAQVYCTTNSTVNALLTGKFNIYLQQPLVNSGTTADNVSINVFYSLEDFTFYGHNVNNVVGFLTPADTTDIVTQTLPIPAPPLNSVQPTIMKAESSFTPYNVNNQQLLETVDVHTADLSPHDMRPIVSIRDYLRRYTLGDLTTTTLAGGSLRGLVRSTLGPLSTMFAGFLGGLKVKIELPASSTIERFYYLPPNEALTSTGKLTWGSTALPFKSVATAQSRIVGNMKVFEFVIIPQTPFKFLDYTGQTSLPGDFLGSLYAVSATNQIVALPAITPIFLGITDEARFGFQCIVPPIDSTTSTFADELAKDDAVQNNLYFFKS
jgi:hypothetical protein